MKILRLEASTETKNDCGSKMKAYAEDPMPFANDIVKHYGSLTANDIPHCAKI